MTLPTREEVADWDDEQQVINAYISGDLLTRAEWEASVDGEANLDIIAETMSDFEPCETVEDRHYEQARHLLKVLGILGIGETP